MCPGFDSRTRRHMWVEFVVGSLLCSESFFLRVLRFSPFLKNQLFQIPIRSWNARTCELLNAPWVNNTFTFCKMQFESILTGKARPLDQTSNFLSALSRRIERVGRSYFSRTNSVSQPNVELIMNLIRSV